jgi:hypothetical protein
MSPKNLCTSSVTPAASIYLSTSALREASSSLQHFSNYGTTAVAVAEEKVNSYPINKSTRARNSAALAPFIFTTSQYTGILVY